MTYEIESVQQPRQPYVAVRATVRLDAIGEAMGPLRGRLFGWLGSHGIEAAGAPWTRYLDVGVTEVELEVAAPVRETMTAEGPVIAGVVPGGSVVRTLHVGPYERLPEAYEAVNAWMAEHHVQPAGAMWEVHLDGPEVAPDRSRTIVVLPVSPAAA